MMRKSLLSVAAASLFLAGGGLAFAQSEAHSEQSWTAAQGPMMTEYSTTKHYISFKDPTLTPTIGMELPATVQLYALPDTMKSPTADRYQYGMVNDHPVVVETTTRKIVHTWN
jgi:Protein of unknown function (DUF1236)